MISLYRKQKFIFCFTLFISLCGMFLASQLPISLYPMVNKPTVRITLRATQDVFSFYQERGIEIEQSLKTIEHVKTVEGTYKQGLIRYHIHFDWNVDPETAKRDVATVASFYQSQLPDHEPDPIVDFLDPSSENYLAITSDKYTNAELSKLLKDNLKPQLDAIDGVAASKVSQKEIPFLSVRLKPYKMLEYDIGLEQVLDTLEKHQYDYKLGRLQTEEQGRLSIKFKKSFSTVEQLRDLRLNSTFGNPVYLSDIATINVETEVNHRFFQLDEKPIVAVAVWPKPGSNIYQVSADFQELVFDNTRDMGDVVILNNPRRFIEDAIMSIVYALLTGMATAAFVVLLCYRKFKSTVIICIAMPIALSIGILIMHLLGVGINLLSLGGMSICVGLVVDNVIIIIDKLERQYKETGPLSPETITIAMKSIAPPVITSTLTSVVVFLPLAFTVPAVATILKDISLVTVTIILASSFLSLLFVPVCFVMMSRKKAAITKSNAQKNVTNGLAFRGIVGLLAFFERQRLLRTILVIGAFLSCSYAIYFFAPQLRTEIVAKPKAEIIDVNIMFNESGLTDTDKMRVIKPLREIIYDKLPGDVKYVYTDVRENMAFLSLHLKSYQVFDKVYKKLGEIIPENPDADISFSPWVTSALNIKDHPGIEIKLLGQDESRNRELAQWAYQYAKEQKELVRKSKNKPGNRQSRSLEVRLNEKILNQVLNVRSYQEQVSQLQDYIEYSSEPRKLYDVKLDKETIPLKVEVDGSKNSIQMLQSIPIEIDNRYMFLRDLVHLETKKEWRQYYSQDGVLRYQVDVWFHKNVDAQAVELFKTNLISHLKQKSGLQELPVVFNSNLEEVEQALSSLQVAMLFSVVAVFLIVLLQFGEIRQALMVSSVIIFGVAGAIIALFFYNSTLSINSLLGILILVGLTVNNSILLLDQYHQQISMNNKVESITLSLFIRMRSLVVTNLTTIAGMFPLVIGFGPGKEILQPLGIAVSFGLVFATLSTLIFFPLMLLYLQGRVKQPLHSSPIEPGAVASA